MIYGNSLKIHLFFEKISLWELFFNFWSISHADKAINTNYSCIIPFRVWVLSCKLVHVRMKGETGCIIVVRRSDFSRPEVENLSINAICDTNNTSNMSHTLSMRIFDFYRAVCSSIFMPLAIFMLQEGRMYNFLAVSLTEILCGLLI